MAKRKYTLTESQIQKRIKEGRGAGSGRDYKPWHYVHEVPSAGRSQRVYSHLTQRVHHLLSDLEYAVFLMLHHNPMVTDIREQFPLLRNDTLRIANDKQIKHPSEGKVDLVMSSDFLVSTKLKSLPLFAVQVKYKDEFKDTRTVEKLEIENCYWKYKQLPFHLVTEQQIEKTIKENVNWLYGVTGWHDELLDEELISAFEVMQQHFITNPNQLVLNICKRFDSAYQLELGQSLLDFRSMCASRMITFDYRKPFNKLTAGELVFHTPDAITRGNYVAS